MSYAGTGAATDSAGRTSAPATAGNDSVPVVSAPPVAAQSGSVAPPVAGNPGTVSVPPPPAAGRGEPALSMPFDAGSDPTRNNVRAGELCARLAVIQCATEIHCCTAPTRSRSQCESALRTACKDELFLDTMSQNPITGFDAAFTAQMFTELESRSALCDLTIPTWSISPLGLRGILKGTLQPNASCKPPGTGVTDKAAQAAALASCKNIETHACLPKSLLGDWLCSPKSGIGANCITDDNCQTDMYCRNPNMAPLGKCAARVAVGGSCSTGGECVSLFCKSGTCVAPETQLAFCGN